MSAAQLNTALLAVLLALSAWTVHQVHATAVDVAALAEHARALDGRIAALEAYQVNLYGR